MSADHGMTLYSKALKDLAEGRPRGPLVMIREDGHRDEYSLDMVLSDRASPLEAKALELCRGRILDAGAGAGRHSLRLQAKGLEVVSVDISPEACGIMRSRGVKDPRCADFLTFEGGAFDTVLLLGRSLGVVGSLTGFERFLRDAPHRLAPGGQILFDSLDVMHDPKPPHAEYVMRKVAEGLYPGEMTLRMEYDGVVGETWDFLHVDPATASALAFKHGWKPAIVAQEGAPYLMHLTRD